MTTQWHSTSNATETVNAIIWPLKELIELEKERVSITIIENKDWSSFLVQTPSISRKELKVTDKVQYTYWPPHRHVEWYADDVSPKEVYELLNPNNEPCQFDVQVGGKTYSFFHNIHDGKTYRFYHMVEVKKHTF